MQHAIDQIEIENQALANNSKITASGSASSLFSLNKVAYVALSLNMNNIISTPLYLIMLCIDSVVLIYMLLSIIYSQVYDQPINTLWLLERNLYDMNDIILIIVHGIMIFYQILTLVVFVVLLMQDLRTIFDTEKQSTAKKALIFAIVILDVVLKAPLLVIIYFGFDIPNLHDIDIQKGLSNEIKQSQDTMGLSEVDINSAVFYIFLLNFVLIGMSFVMNYFWDQSILEKIKTEEIKTHNQYLQAFRVLQYYIDQVSQQKSNLYESMSFILSLIKFHNLNCQNNTCFCHHTDSLIWVLKRAQNQVNENYIDIYQDELELLNNYNINPFIVPSANNMDSPFQSNQYINKERIIIQIDATQDTHLPNNHNNYNSESLSSIDLQAVSGSFNNAPLIRNMNDLPIDNQEPILKLDLIKLIQSYLLEYQHLLFKEALIKFPKDPTISLNYQYFCFFYLHNIFMANNQLRIFDYSHFSTINKASYLVNEAYMILLLSKNISKRKQIENGFKYKQYGIVFDDQQIAKNSYQSGAIQDYMGEDSLDPEHFIHVNYTTQLFYNGIQQLSVDVMDFWKSLSDNTGSLDVKKTQVQGNIVSERIGYVQKQFHRINSLSKYADHKIYHCFAQVQKLILNDHQAYELYLNKMKSLITMQKLFKNNSLKFYTDTDLGVLLANGTQQEFGKIILTNQILMKVLGFSTQDLRHQRIGILQPKLIKENHDKFISRFLSTGQSNFMHTMQNLFLLNKNGYVLPFQVYKNGPKYIPKDLMFMLCDRQGYIYEISESCSQQIGLHIILKVVEDSVQTIQQIQTNRLDEQSTINNAMQFQNLEEEKDFQLHQKVDSISSSDSYSHVEQELIKQSISGLEKQTPRSLKVVVAQKMNLNNRIRIILRTLSNVANGYENNQLSYVSGIKTTVFEKRLMELINSFRQVQISQENQDFEMSNSFSNYLKSENLRVQYLNEKNQIFINNHTMSFTLNLYVSRLLDIYNLKNSQFKGNLHVQSLTFNTSSAYVPTEIERNIFFVIANSLDAIREHLQIEIEYYSRDIKDHSEESKASTETTIIISVCSILFVGLIVTPLLSRIVDRQYQALQFFLLIDQIQIDNLIFKCFQCIQEVNELLALNKSTQNNQIGNPRTLNNDFSSSQISQDEISYSYNDYTRHQDKTITDMEGLNQSAFSNDRFEYGQGDGRDSYEEQKVGARRVSQIKKVTQNNIKSHKALDFERKSRMINNSSKDLSSIRHSINHNEIELQDMSSFNTKQNATENQLNTVNNADQQYNQADHHKNKGEQTNENETLDEKKKIIKQTQIKKRVRVTASSLLVIMALSSYFIASYFMSLRIFNSIPEMIDALGIIYYKEEISFAISHYSCLKIAKEMHFNFSFKNSRMFQSSINNSEERYLKLYKIQVLLLVILKASKLAKQAMRIIPR
ncbi:UNKNOWN [Stylonychia lemnae]|uniref:Pas domain s-box family protein n=1 Tax=Stylonychia lemnae TaxID=5949 RepID=A0A078ALL2_STYLE|nr:UNKNOWN [Stylonychia lemnae]|eukprot:CDW83114.1 UNKNOWN [Stylonychia lemnae]